MTQDVSERDLQAIRKAFERVSARAWGLALAVLAGVGLFLATAMLLVQGGADPGPHLGLLGEYFPGYTVSWPGAFIGFAYGWVVGYATGFFVGTLYNRIVARIQS
jgi:hypothetical protein